MGLADVLGGVNTLVGGLSGVRCSAKYPPEQFAVGATAAVYPRSGVYKVAPNDVMRGMHEVGVALGWPRGDLAVAIKAAMGFSESLPNVLMADQTLGGTASAFGGMRYKFGEMVWGRVAMVGWEFTLVEVKEETALTMGAETRATGNLQSAVAGLQDLMLTVSGVRAAPDYAPDMLGIYPFVVAYAKEGKWEPGVAGERIGEHSIEVEVHVSRGDLPVGVKAAVGYLEDMAQAILQKRRLGGAAENVRQLRYAFGGMEWNGVETVGFRLTLEGVRYRGINT